MTQPCGIAHHFAGEAFVDRGRDLESLACARAKSSSTVSLDHRSEREWPCLQIEPPGFDLENRGFPRSATQRIAGCFHRWRRWVCSALSDVSSRRSRHAEDAV